MSFIVVFDLLRMSGARWTKPAVRRGLLGVVALMTLAGLYASLIHTLIPVEALGVLRYVEDGAATPAWAGVFSVAIAMLTMVVFLIAGIVFMFKYRWPWLFLGSLLAFIGNGAPTGDMRFLISSIVEVIFVVAVSNTIVTIRKRSAARV